MYKDELPGSGFGAIEASRGKWLPSTEQQLLIVLHSTHKINAEVGAACGIVRA
jgi:hypothetical protein